MNLKNEKKGTFVLDGDDCIDKTLDFSLKFKGEEQKFKKKIVEYNSQLHAHNASDFDTWIFLNTLPCDKHIVGFEKIGQV